MQINKRQCEMSDQDLMLLVREIIKEKPTYGYRRVTAVINTRGIKANHKRLYRVMKENKLLLSKYGPKPMRVHDGNIITLHPNTRWCSDGFVITCSNGDRVYIVFVMDTCDREVLRYVASTRGINGGMIRNLMAESMLYRFNNTNKLPKTIQWLSGNGSCYTARETVKFGRELGFDICTTPPYSPESNGMAEALVKTFKRDYVWLGDLSCAAVVSQQLPIWFEDYNENAPHKGLKMLSPRQYI